MAQTNRAALDFAGLSASGGATMRGVWNTMWASGHAETAKSHGAIHFVIPSESEGPRFLFTPWPLPLVAKS